MDAELQCLLQEVIAGSESAAKRLFEKYRKFLIFLIRQRLHRNLRARFDSIDIAQDVWASFFAEPLEKRAFSSSDQLIGFLAQLAQHKLKDAEKHGIQAKKRDATRELSMDDSHRFDKHALPASDDTPSQILMSREEWTCFLNKQPRVYREILILMRDGKTQAEIAMELNINERLIRRVLNRLTPEALAS